MKKIISFLLILCMLISMLPVFSTAASATTYLYMLGDANDDGTISVKDINVVKRYILAAVTVKGINLSASDVGGDGWT